ncbi:MAG: permease [Candidatus Omnitrophica bacterium]|nr:permease [Candidatus Omnitrophota bacterium]
MSDCCVKAPQKSFFANKVVLLTLIVGSVLAASFMVPLLVAFREVFTGYVRILFWPLVLGLLVGGVIDYYIPREYVSLILAGKKRRNILYAVVWGFTMTLCCHGILAIAIQLYKKGAAPSSVVAFLLASPWANFPLTLMLIGFFGPARAGYIILSAIVIALITGWIFQVFEKKGMIETNPHTVEMARDFDIWQDVKQRMVTYRFDLLRDMKGILKGVRDLSEMVLWWILLGMTLAAAMGAYVPDHFFHRFMGKSFAGMSMTLLFATVVETCSEGSSPLAFEIFRQTGALGNALVFLMAGVATDYTEIGLLWANAGWRTALWMPAICVPLILFFGYMGNVIFH